MNYLKCILSFSDIILAALKHFMREVIGTRKLYNVLPVVKALPLYHFLNDQAVPHQPSHVSLRNIMWGAPAFHALKDFMDDKPG